VRRHPVANLKIGVEGDGGSAITGEDGRARIRLANQTREKSSVSLQIVKSPPGKDLVMVSPRNYSTQVPSLCAGHAQQLGGESPPANLMEGYRREAGSEGSMEQTCESMDKNRIQGVSTRRAGNLSRSPYPSKARSVDSAAVHGKQLSLPQEICSASLRRLRWSYGRLTAGQKSAYGIVGQDVGDASKELPTLCELEHFLFYCRPLRASLNQAWALPGVMHGRASVIACSSVSLVRGLAARSSCLSFAQAFSIGFRSGE